MNPRLICIIGLDGAGKTTQAKTLTRTMKLAGMNVTYRYGRFIPLLSRPLILLGSKLLKSRASIGGSTKDNYRDFVSFKRKALKNRTLSRLVEIIYFADYSLQLLAKITVPLTMGRTVICDRYIHDTVVTDIAPDLGYDIKSSELAIRRLLRLFRTPDVLIHIRLDPQKAFKRKNDVADVEYLVERAGNYDIVAADFSAVTVDGSMDIDEVQREILSVTIGSATSKVAPNGG